MRVASYQATTITRAHVTKWSIEGAACYFEGEGCVSIYNDSRSGQRRYVRLTISSTDRDVLERFQDAVGYGTIYACGGGTNKQLYVWRVYAREKVEPIIRAFYPYLGERRRAKVDEALAILQDVGYGHSRRTRRPSD